MSIVAYYKYLRQGKIVLVSKKEVVKKDMKEIDNPGAFYSKSRHSVYQVNNKSFTTKELEEIDEFLTPIIQKLVKPPHEHLHYIRTLLTYDDLDEEEKILSAVEYIDSIVLP